MQLSPLDTTWLLFCAFFVMVMQAGFCLLETGMVRSKNSINVAFKNLSDFTVAACVYWLVGYGFMYGETFGGWVGLSGFAVDHSAVDGAWFLYQMMFCGAATTIVGGALAERTRFSAYLALSVMIAAVIYPVAGHWIWGGVIEGEATGRLAVAGFIDFAGGTAVHSVGGWLALAAVMVVGPRLGRFNGEGRHRLKGSNYSTATVGVILLWFGWFGFNAGSGVGYQENIPLIVINTALAAAAGGITLTLYRLWRSGVPEIEVILNGTLAGLVGVTAGCHLYSTYDAVLVGIISAFTYYLAAQLLARFEIDDVISAFPVHGAAGVVGTLLLALFGDPALFPTGHSVAAQFAVQLGGVISVGLWAFGVGYLMLSVLNRFVPLRVSEEAERQGLNVSEHNASTELLDLVTDMAVQEQSGDFTALVDVEPHTEIGEIATQYNKVLDRVRLEIKTREKAYAQLKDASHFQYIFENASEGILQLSVNGDILQVNPSAAKILGFSSTDILVSAVGPFMQNLQCTENSSHEKLFSTLNETGQATKCDLEFKRQVDGKTGHALCTIRHIAGTAEQDSCFIVSLLDTTERQENERLRVERNAAEAASLAKSQFLSNMSHEIRTPLNGVSGMLELLSRTELDERQMRYIDTAQNSAGSLLSVINDILDFSKIEAGKLEIESVEYRLRETLADVVDMFAMVAATKKLELISNIKTDIPDFVIGDPERFRQVMISILGNAIKFTESGSVFVTATCLSVGEANAMVEVKVEDTGCGMKEKTLDHLFNSFTQADGSATRKYGGTGLGLTISQKLIGLMNGKISVSSEVDRGSVFTLTFDFPLPEKKADQQDQLPFSVTGTRVLVVDDHEVNQQLLEELLQQFGMIMVCAANGAEGIRAAQSASENGESFDLLLLDYQMPEMDGLQLAKILRADGLCPDAKVILLTSVDSIDDSASVEEYTDAMLTKPVRASRLFDTISSVLVDGNIGKINKLEDRISAEITPLRPSGLDQATPSTVLLVEDNPINQLVATELLEHFGFKVEVAGNGEEGVDRFKQGGIDLILMDCQMPVLDGFDATVKIRSLEAGGETRVPIVALTANALKGDREKCLEVGMDDYLTKPVNATLLREVLSDYVFVSDEDASSQDTGT